jgi:hypothetical protein
MNVKKFSVIDLVSFKNYRDKVMIRNKPIYIYALNSYDAIERGCYISDVDITKSTTIGEIVL